MAYLRIFQSSVNFLRRKGSKFVDFDLFWQYENSAIGPARPWNSRRRFSSASLSAGVGPSRTRLKAATEVSAQKGFRTMPGLDPALWI